MEGLLSLCLVALSTLLALWFLIRPLSCRKSKPATATKQLPPGPWTLPIIGSLHHVVSLLPHRQITELSRQHGPLMHLMLGELPTVIVSSAEVAALAMKTNDLAFASRPHTVTTEIFGCGGKDIGFAPYGDHWRQMRKICIVELLSSKQMKRMEGIRAEEVGNLLRSVSAAASTGATINVSEKMSALSNDVVTRAVFGGKFAQQSEYLRELSNALALLSSFCLVDVFPSSRLVRWLTKGARRMKTSCASMHRIIADILNERKATRAAAGYCNCSKDDEDLLDVLLRLQEENSLAFPLTTEIIAAVLFDIFSGATETTGIVLGWAMSELVCNPEIMSKAQQEVREILCYDRTVITNSDLVKLQYVQMVIKEVLRLHPPAPLIPRATREDCTIMGYDIPNGTNVFINVFAILRDPRHWENPEEFKPERFENNDMNYNGTYFDFIPFGAGRRQCPGIRFGSSLMEMTLTNCLYHFNWKLPDGASLDSFDMSEKYGISVGRRYGLQLKAIPHM